MKFGSIKHTSFTALLLGLLFLAACSSTPPKLQFTVVAEDIMWSTTEIHAKVNQPIELTLRNDGALDHDFTIEELGIDVLLHPGDIQIVNFTVDHVASIKYICSIPGHEEAGMVGEIIITE
jgi:heme/copper-type cytochrome/quinol oxidase subunit 2